MSVIGLRLELVNNKGAKTRVRVYAAIGLKPRAMVRFVSVEGQSII